MTATASAHPVVPSLFVSHGAPLFAVDAGETGPALTRWGQALRAQFPGLRGVVVMSPHWMARGVRVTTGASLPHGTTLAAFRRRCMNCNTPRRAHRRWRRRCWICWLPQAWPRKAMHSAPSTMVPGCR